MTERGKVFVDARAQVMVVRGFKDSLHRAETENEKRYLNQKLNQATTVMNRAETRARKLMDNMRPELYAFCALYYLAGLSLAETAEAIDRSERQCARYKHSIERE